MQNAFPLRSEARGPENTVTVLAVSGHDEDHCCLQEIFAHSNWVIYRARTCGEALSEINSRRIPVIIAERDLPDGDWKLLFSKISLLAEPPLLIVTSIHADDNLWAEVLNLGGYDVLPKPLDSQEIVRVVGLAWLQWRRKAGSRERTAPEPQRAEISAAPAVSASRLRATA